MTPPPEPITGNGWVDIVLHPAIISLLVTVIIGAVYRLVDVKRPRMRVYSTFSPHNWTPTDSDPITEHVFILTNTGDGPAFNVTVMGYGAGWMFDPHEGDFGPGRNGGQQEDSKRPLIGPGVALRGHIRFPQGSGEGCVMVVAWEQRTPFFGIRERSWVIPLWGLPEFRGPQDPPTSEDLSSDRSIRDFGRAKAKNLRSDILRPPRRWGRDRYPKLGRLSRPEGS